jgi:hypothetical protein
VEYSAWISTFWSFADIIVATVVSCAITIPKVFSEQGAGTRFTSTLRSWYRISNPLVQNPNNLRQRRLDLVELEVAFDRMMRNISSVEHEVGNEPL